MRPQKTLWQRVGDLGIHPGDTIANERRGIRPTRVASVDPADGSLTLEKPDPSWGDLIIRPQIKVRIVRKEIDR